MQSAAPVVSGGSSDVRPPCASESRPGRLGPDEAASPSGFLAGDGGPATSPSRDESSTGCTRPEGPLAASEPVICDGCGLEAPDEIGLSLPGLELGFHSLACFVVFIRRTFMEAR